MSQELVWLNELYEDAPLIREDLDSGCELAKRIAIGYSLLEKCPGDPGAQGVTHAAYEDWKRARRSR